MTSVCRSKASFRYVIVAVSGFSVIYCFTVSLSSSRSPHGALQRLALHTPPGGVALTVQSTDIRIVSPSVGSCAHPPPPGGMALTAQSIVIRIVSTPVASCAHPRRCGTYSAEYYYQNCPPPGG